MFYLSRELGARERPTFKVDSAATVGILSQHVIRLAAIPLFGKSEYTSRLLRGDSDKLPNRRPCTMGQRISGEAQ